MTHELKTDSPVFQATKTGLKTYEIRRNDRNFQVGDDLFLRETIYTGEEMNPRYKGGIPGTSTPPGKPLSFTGETLLVSVLHILVGPIYGLSDGWCIMAIEPKQQVV